MSRLPAQPNQSLIDGIAVLQAVAESIEPVSGARLARELGMEPTRVNRLLKTLEYLGIVRRNRARRYLPGSGMHVLSAQSLFASGILQKALPYLEELANQSNLVVALGVCWRNRVTYLYHHRRNGLPLELGRQAPYDAGASSLGMVLLAQATDEQLCDQFPDGKVPGYPNSFEQFLSDVRDIRQQGYALLDRKHLNLALPLAPETGAALALSDFYDIAETPKLLLQLRDTAQKINQTLQMN